MARSSSSRTSPSRLVGLLQFVALLQRLLQRDPQLLGHHGHDGVDAEDGHAQRAAHVADRRPGGQRAEGADLGDVLLPYLSLTYWITSPRRCLAEVDVDVGRFEAVLVEEPLEEQVVLSGQTWLMYEGVADQRADARAAGRRLDALLAGETDEVPDDEEVVGEAELVDHAQLAVEPLDDLVAKLAVGVVAPGRRRSAPVSPSMHSSRR